MAASFLRRSRGGGRHEDERAPELRGCGPGRTDPGPAPDDVPRGFAEPVSVTDLDVLPPEPVDDGRLRITFHANVRAADGARCPDVAVEARVTGPEREGDGMGWTDEFGQVRFRMTGPPGEYRCEITSVGAGAVDVTRDDDGAIATASIRADRTAG